MINDKCPMINESGYALIAMVFIMVAFFSAIFLVSYPLVQEGKDDSTRYIIERNDYRWRKAVFGSVVDQSGVKLTRCGGYVSDCMGLKTKGGSRGSIGHNVISARLYAPNVIKGFVTGEEEYEPRIYVPSAYKFSGKLWAGYWGKRYIHVLPSDDWRYYVYTPVKDWPYHPFYLMNGMYARPRMYNYCQGTCACSNGAKGSGFKIGGYSIKLKVKDSSPQKNGHELRFVLAGYNGVLIEYDDSKTCSIDYCLYTVSFNKSTGEKKLMIQVNDNPADPDSPWITRDTRIMISPISTGAKSNRIYRINFYG